MRFRKRTAVVEAHQLMQSAGPGWSDFTEWCERVGFKGWSYGRRGTLVIPTVEHVLIARPGDWITKDADGNFCAFPPEVFNRLFEPIEEKQLARSSSLHVVR